jgi:predicted metalloendopeptidase
MESRIGFASYLANSSFLLEYHKDLVVDQKDFFVNLINSEIFFRKQKLSLLWNPSLEKVFQEPQDADVQYYPNNNMITIPVGAMISPLLDATLPSVLNYASFGSVLGFHLTDAFRHLSRKLNKEEAALFETKLECFGKEFDVAVGTDEIEKQRKSLQHFVALSSGLDLSYSAYNSSNADGSKLALPGVKFSNDQLFFMWYAQTWCGKEREQNNGASTFLSNKNLVNGAVKNNPSFIKAFKCPKTSQPKCSLWS